MKHPLDNSAPDPLTPQQIMKDLECMFDTMGRSISGSYVALVDRGSDPNCRIYSDAEIKAGKT